jgi:MFS family permease
MKILDAFPALRERNFRLYFYTQLISFVGTYLQATAQGWLVLQLTHSAFWVGFVGAIIFLPAFIFVLFGGAIADRFNRRSILYFTQVVAMLLAFILGVLTITHRVNLAEIIILAVCLGVINALDTPARSAFVSDMITDRNNLASAVSLNSGMGTTALAVGPAVAGILIALFGTGWTFIINGFTFVAAIIAMYAMNISMKNIEKKVSTGNMIKDGIRYLLSNKNLLFLILLSGALVLFGLSYDAILPVIATQIYNGGAETFGYISSAFGIGAAASAVVLSMLSKKASSRFWIVGGNILVGLSLIALSLVHVVAWGFVFILLAGFTVVTEFAMIMTVIQHTVPETMRGRVLSIFYFLYFGCYGIGSFFMGLSAQRFGPAMTVGTSGLIAFLIGVTLLFFKEKILEVA